MINLKLLFGSIPATSIIEEKRAKLISEFEEINAITKSKELKEYYELEKLIRSAEFISGKKKIISQSYTQTEEYIKEKEYVKLKKEPDVKNYYAILNSSELQSFNIFVKSKELAQYNKLKDYINSPEFKKAKSELKKKDFLQSNENQKLQEYRSLEKSEYFVKSFKFKKSKKYNKFLAVQGSDRIKHFEKLEKFISSDKIKELKNYMALPGRKKYEISEEYKKEARYNELKNSEKFIWYFKTKDSKKFDFLKTWNISFEDTFNEKKLDRKKWITRYFWGEALLHDGYALANEKHYYTDGENLEINNNVLKIITRKENIKGRAWNPKIGFFPKKFEYTSGLISTGKNFRQLYGIFEAKIKFNSNMPLQHSMWMRSDKIVPHIEVVKAYKKVKFSNYSAKPQNTKKVNKFITSLKREKFDNDYFIYTLEWAPTKLTWKINDFTIASTGKNVPQIPLYLNIGSGLYNNPNGINLPAHLEIDWIRCYQKTNA